MVVVSGNPTFISRDEAGNRVEEDMGAAEGELPKAYVVPSWEPHLVENRTDEPVVVYEVRDRFSDNFAALTGDESLRQEAQ